MPSKRRRKGVYFDRGHHLGLAEPTLREDLSVSPRVIPGWRVGIEPHCPACGCKAFDVLEKADGDNLGQAEVCTGCGARSEFAFC